MNWATKPRDISLLRLIYDPSMNIEAKQMDMKKNPTIRCKEATLEFLGENSQGGIAFEFTNLVTGMKEILDFNLGWWSSWINYSAWNGGQNSGDYIFRPLTGQFDTMKYSSFHAATGSESKYGSMMSFYFLNNTSGVVTDEREVTVHVSFDQDLNLPKFIVDMNSLPVIDLDGYEIVSEFSVRNFSNNQIFYTDSNGL